MSRQHALFTATGIATGSLAWATAAALGVASILETLPLLGLALKLSGIAYLIYLGITLLRSKGIQPSARPGKRATRRMAGFWRGFLVNMTNPKSAAYYASVFAAFLTPEMPAWVLVVLVGAIALMSLIWHSLIAIGFSASRVQARYITVSQYVDRLCGGVLIYLGLHLAWGNR